VLFIIITVVIINVWLREKREETQEYETLVQLLIKTFYFSQIATPICQRLKISSTRLGAPYVRDRPSILRFLSVTENQDANWRTFGLVHNRFRSRGDNESRIAASLSGIIHSIFRRSGSRAEI